MVWTVYHICLLLGLGFSVFSFFIPDQSEVRTKTHRAVFLVILATVLLEVSWNVMSNDGYSILLYNLLFVYGKVMLLLFLFYNIPFSCGLEEKVSLAFLVFLAVGILNSIFFQPLQSEVQTHTHLFGNFLVLFFSIFFFKDILRHSKYKNINLLSLPFFWIATFTLFATGESIIFTFFSTWFFPDQTSNLGFVQLFVYFFSGLMYLVFGLAFYAPMLFRKAYV
jgi:hypothetical protein